jgi:hypothetical protein
MTLLGTLTTTSGASQSLTGLTLTDYKYLYCSLNGVSGTSGDTITIISGASTSFTLFTAGSAASRLFYGTVFVNLENGSLGAWGRVDQSTVYGISPTVAAANTDGVKYAFGRISQSTASTSIGFGVGAGTFDAGTITIYGVK